MTSNFATVAWTPGIVAGFNSVTTTVTVAGAAVGQAAVAGFDQVLPTDLFLHAQVIAANTVQVSLRNDTAGASNVPAGNVTVGALGA